MGRGAPSSSPPPAEARPTRPHRTTTPHAVVLEPLSPETQKLLELQRTVLDRVSDKLKLKEIPADLLGDEELWQRAESTIIEHVETMDASGDIPPFVDQDQLIKETLNEALGLGPLEDLLADEDVSEIIVDRQDRVLVTRHGILAGAGKAFSSADTLRQVVERLVASSGYSINEDNPFVDLKLRDGSRLAAAIPPVAVRGACLTLRKRIEATHSLAGLLATQTMSSQIGDFLQTCILARQNVLVCGAPSSGKTAILTALAQAAPVGERVVSIEEVSELSLDRDDWIGLEARRGDGNGVAPVSMGQLLRGALRMRPDRLVVSDIQGSLAYELVTVMASSNDGALASVSGDSAASGLARLTSMVRLANSGATVAALRELVGCAIDIVVHVARYADGEVRITQVAEVQGANDEGFELRELFCFDGAQTQQFCASGVVPLFYKGLKARGIDADSSIFSR